jgi:hypothetical protein
MELSELMFNCGGMPFALNNTVNCHGMRVHKMRVKEFDCNGLAGNFL